MQQLDYKLRGQDFQASADVKMRYSNLALILRKTDKETGETKAKKFATKIVNKFILWPSNPGSDGKERIAVNIKVSRLTTQAFFGLIWKTVFAGMEEIMMRSGRYE